MLDLTGIPLLSIIIFLPLLGVLGVMLTGKSAGAANNAKIIALFSSLVTFVISLLLWVNFDSTNPGFQFLEQRPWLPAIGLTWQVGIDGMSLFFILLATFLTPICILASWETIQHRVKEYMIAFLALETFMIGMFAALDMVVFYVFFEAVLVPMFLIIGVWGGQNRRYAAFKLFLYTLLGSVLMLIGLLALYNYGETTSMPVLLETVGGVIPPSVQNWLWLGFFAAFAVKVPMVPVHTWLPDAHVQAPTAGSVILAGVLLKMGAYGFIRFSIPMLPVGTETFTPLVYGLSIAAVIYTSLIALVQEDMKKLIAYSSIAHMGFVTVGLFTLTETGVSGAIFQMLSHGVVSGALFLCVGVVYDRLHTREIAEYGGVVKMMPKFAVLFLLFTMASIGLPGTAGFVGEFLVLQGAFIDQSFVAALIAFGMVLGAAYMLYLYRRVMLGQITNDAVNGMADLTRREKSLFVPLAILALWMGIAPGAFLQPMEAPVQKLISQYETQLAGWQKGSDMKLALTNTMNVIPANAGIQADIKNEFTK